MSISYRDGVTFCFRLLCRVMNWRKIKNVFVTFTTQILQLKLDGVNISAYQYNLPRINVLTFNTLKNEDAVHVIHGRRNRSARSSFNCFLCATARNAKRVLAIVIMSGRLFVCLSRPGIPNQAKER